MTGAAGPGPLDPPALRTALRERALDYLARYAASREAVRRVLVRRLRKLAPEADPGEAAGLVGEVLDGLAADRLIDDAGLAAARAQSLHRSGRSIRAIGLRLAGQGIGRTEREAALRSLAEEEPDADLLAAWRLARRKRLGPFRDPDARAARHAADLLVLRRAGFALGVARTVLDADPDDAPPP